MEYKFKDGERVEFNDGINLGYGFIKGCSTTGHPIIGKNYMIEVLASSVKIPNETYPFKVIPMMECHIKSCPESDYSH